jgi:hypothetical protein
MFLDSYCFLKNKFIFLQREYYETIGLDKELLAFEERGA